MSRYFYIHEVDFKNIIRELFPGSFDNSPFAYKIVNEIIDVLPLKVNGKYVSKKLFISERWLQKECKRAFKISFNKLNKILRVYSAVQLLLRTNLNNSQIAFELNYCEESNMARDFKLLLQQNPHDVRLKLSNLSPEEIMTEYIQI